MSESKRDITKHPVWDVYDMYRNSRLSVLYYSEKLNWYKELNSFIEIVLAVTTASSAVAALWLWNTQVGQELWKYILVISAILAVVKPVIKLTDKMQQFEEILAGYRSLEHDLKTIVIRIRQSKKYGMPHRTKLLEALTRQGELLKKLPEAKPEKKLQEKCRLQVMKELPVEYFFVPKDK